MDNQQTEIIGKHLLIANLIAADLEVAEPIRDHGIDLVAFRDGTDGGKFAACPIQLKTATDEGFCLYEKYNRFPGLRIVYVWHANDRANAQFFVLTYQEALAVLKEMKYDLTKSWQEGKSYITTRPSDGLKTILKRFEVNSLKEWASKLGLVESSAG